jgi:hypothetical protein
VIIRFQAKGLPNTAIFFDLSFITQGASENVGLQADIFYHKKGQEVNLQRAAFVLALWAANSTSLSALQGTTTAVNVEARNVLLAKHSVLHNRPACDALI